MWLETVLLCCAGCISIYTEKIHMAVCFFASVFYIILYGRTYTVKELLLGSLFLLVLLGCKVLSEKAEGFLNASAWVLKVAICILVCIVVVKNYVPTEHSNELTREQATAYFIAITSLLLFSVRIRMFISEKMRASEIWIYRMFIPALGFYIVERVFNENINKMEWQFVAGNVLVLFLMTVILYGFIPVKIMSVLFLTICLVFGVGNYYVGRFRGSPIMPNDLYSVNTAFQVAGGYEFDISEPVIAGVLCWYAGIAILCCLPGKYTVQKQAARGIWNEGSSGKEAQKAAMIVSFLCLIGPGAVTCLLRARGVHEGAGGNRGCAEPGSLGAHRRHAPVIFILLEVLAYAVIHMAITTILLYPSGEAEIVVLPNGMPAVRYGPAALLLSVMLAAAAGLWGQPVRALKVKGRGKRIVMYAAAIAAAVGLLVFPAGSSPAEFQSCTVPVKLNHAFCGDTELLRVSGGEEPEYFIALHTLSKGLGLDCGVEQAGLFRIRYYLGNTVFSVNRMTPDRNYCLRGKELFISLACLRGDEPFLDIRVQDAPVLADGSSREIIYIEYDPKRFDPGWAIDGTDAADGSVEGAADGIITVSPVQNFSQDDNHGDFAQDRNDGTRVYVIDLQNMTDARLKNTGRKVRYVMNSNRKNKKIILINYTGRHGGGPLHAYELTKALLEQGFPAAAVLSADIENGKAWKRLPLEKLILIPTYTSAVSFLKNHLQFVLYKKYRIRKALQSYEVTAVCCPMCTFWTDPVSQLFPRARKIVFCHDPVLHAGESYAFAVKLFGVNRAYRHADEIIVHTKKFVAEVETRYHKTGHVHYLPLGRHSYYRSVPTKRTAVTYDPEKTNYVFFGRISPYKGLDTLAEAYRKVCSRCSDVTLTIAGAGDFSPYRAAYRRLKRVTVINRWLADEEVESIFQGEHLIAVLPYADATQSGVLMVAMDYGVPVIATDTGGLGEQLEDGVTGLLTDANDSSQLARQMLRLKNDRELYQRICQNMKEKLPGMEWGAAAKLVGRLCGNLDGCLDEAEKECF